MSRITLVENTTAPTTPDANEVHIYAKTDGLLYTKSDNGLELALSPNGERAVDIVVTAGEVLSVRDFVFVDAVTGTAKEIDVDASTPLVGLIRGIVNQAGGIANGATGTVRISGEVTGFSGLTAWSPVYASTTPGGYTQTKPSPSDGGAQVAVVPIGFATSTTAVMVDPKAVTYLKRATTANNGTLTIVHHSDPQGRERRAGAFVGVTGAADVASYASSNQDASVPLRGQSGAGGTLNKDNSGSSNEIGAVAGLQRRWAQQFTPAADGILSQFKFTLVANLGTPTGGISWQICSDAADTPGTVLASGGPTAVTPSAENTVNVTGGPFLGGATKYWLLLFTQTQSGTNSYRWQCASTATYASHTTKYSDNGGSSWVEYNVTREFEVTTVAITSKDKLAQSFQISSTATIDKVRLWLEKTGTPTGTLTCRIETNSGSNPSGTLANANATVTVAESGLSTSYGWIEFDFATNFSLSGSTTYWIVLSTDRSASSTNYVEWGADGSSPSYASGEMRSEASAAWSAESKDGCFEVLQSVTTIDEPCAVGRWSGGTRDVAIRYDDGSGSDLNTKTTFKNTSGGSLDLTVAVEVA